MEELNYNPDILSCIANLSTDEVFTPPRIANEMLDLFPSSIWENTEIKFLDPSCKSGIFLREIVKRLNVGISNEIPDLNQRIANILKKQVHGIAITDLTALLSRRSVYCSKLANSEYSIYNFNSNEQGNIKKLDLQHIWIDERCSYCGANRSTYERGIELESHAYGFIHTNNPEEIFDMRFDVVIGNPPYHLSDSPENVGSSPIYQHFIQQAKKLNPRYISMIIPSRWFAGGKGLDNFRAEMLTDRRIRKLVDYPITSDVFPGLRVIGGVCFFLWDAEHNGPCEVTTVMNGKYDTMTRYLDQFDTFVRFNKAISILSKIQHMGYQTLDKHVSSQKPFGLRTYVQPTGKGDITLYANKSNGLIESSTITKNKHLIDKWKVLISMGYGEGGEKREYPRMILGKPIIAGPSTVCTETYLVVSSHNSSVEANNMASYLRTKFLRFLVGLRKNTQHITSDRFKFVPEISLNRTWSDQDLYDHFGLVSSEIEFIESIIRPMEV
jgi:site-specific DNA-methyltransferase (adenine-specific)